MKLNTVTTKQTEKLFKTHFAKIGRYKPAYVQEAPEAIARKMGYIGLPELSDVYGVMIRQVQRARIDDHLETGTLSAALKEAAMINPEHLLRLPAEYTYMHITIKLFCENLKGLRVLQLASNFGPYLHFLKEVEGANVSGVDILKAAAEYGQEHGLDVRETSSAQLPFADGEFDLVFSKNFLDQSYLSVFGRNCSEEIVVPTLNQVYRVLKPGGHFISELENLPLPGSAFGHPFETAEHYSLEVTCENPLFRGIKVFTK